MFLLATRFVNLAGAKQAKESTTARLGLTLFDLAWLGFALLGFARLCSALLGSARHGRARHDTARHGTARHGDQSQTPTLVSAQNSSPPSRQSL